MSDKKTGPADNFLDYIPVRKIEWQQDENGRVYLIKEKTRNKLLKKIIDFFNKSQFFRIHLDRIGSSAWLLIDGKRSIYDIHREMKAEFGEEFHQSEQRLCFFFAMLKKNKFLDFNDLDQGGRT
jgi:hypothetical protein